MILFYPVILGAEFRTGNKKPGLGPGGGIRGQIRWGWRQILSGQGKTAGKGISASVLLDAGKQKTGCVRYPHRTYSIRNYHITCHIYFKGRAFNWFPAWLKLDLFAGPGWTCISQMLYQFFQEHKFINAGSNCKWKFSNAFIFLALSY